jgi:sporadic carbohydrate cluster 2OG-Fe(II) oxygenase
MIPEYFTEDERLLINEYSKSGYLIRPALNYDYLCQIKNIYFAAANKMLSVNPKVDADSFFNNAHQFIALDRLNDFRVELIVEANKNTDLRKYYFLIAKSYLEAIVGNELAMQIKINLSIQFPGDENSLLPIHADTWSGDSPYEVVLWVPLVDCYNTKSMYILPAEFSSKLAVVDSKKTSDELFKIVNRDIHWIKIKYGEILIFNQGLPHGNRVNEELQTRWSLNCRFKGVFNPYGDKKIGEFFEPITLRPASLSGLNYCMPSVK